jgi:putative phosphoribosyl transferase
VQPPVAPPDTIAMLRQQADEIVCLAEPESFRAIGQWYADFSQVTDDEVRQILDKVWNEPAEEKT